MKQCRHNNHQKEEFDFDIKDRPLVISMDNKCLIWNKELGDWIIKIPNHRNPDQPWEVVKEEIEFVLIEKCWCGAVLFQSRDLSDMWKKISCDSFHKSHAHCGERKNKAENTVNIQYHIGEEPNDAL